MNVDAVFSTHVPLEIIDHALLQSTRPTSPTRERGVMTHINTEVPPSGSGCVECDEAGSWWLHLRRCAACGHIGCCNDSLNMHAAAHAKESGHALIQSYEPGEDWFWDYRTAQFVDGPVLAPPHSRPDEQAAPGPAERLPEDWLLILHSRRDG